MHRRLLGSLAAAGILAGAANAQVTFDFLGLCYATSISADGSVVAGNTLGDYETFRWTDSTGVVRLGRGTVGVLGVGAGTPDISSDGTKISATILGADSTYATQGLWTLGSGWVETMPPTPPDGGLMDYAYGSAWGLSDDGGTLVGLYWRPGQPDGSAHASRWTDTTGVVDLGSDGRDSRANDANADGSVIAGWDANPTFGNWRPAVWVNGVKTILAAPDGFCEASTVNDDGTIVGGDLFIDSTQMAIAAVWRWNGSVWQTDTLGSLPNTFPGYGTVICNDMTPDGSTIVGYNAFDWTQSTGFIWTEAGGMVDVADFLADNGITVPATFDIQTLTGISDDGKTMIGIGQSTYPPFDSRSFLIRTGVSTGIETAASAPAGSLRFARALGNPTRGPTNFALALPRRMDADLTIYDLNGRLVRRLLRGAAPAGRQEIAWDGRDAAGREVPSGVYFYRFAAGAHHETDKIVVVR